MEQTRQRILVVKDNPGDARLIRELLAEGDIQTTTAPCVERLGDALTALTSTTFDPALLDLNLPDSARLDTPRRLWTAAVPELAVVVLTGLADEVGSGALAQRGRLAAGGNRPVHPGIPAAGQNRRGALGQSPAGHHRAQDDRTRRSTALCGQARGA